MSHNIMDGDIEQAITSDDVLDIQDHCTHLLHQLYLLQCNQSMCDAVLTGQQKSIPVHQIILTASSPYFAKCLQSDSNFVFDLNHIDSDILELIVKYVYTGKLTVSKDSVDTIKKICEELELTPAVKACEDYQKFGNEKQLHNVDVSIQTEETEASQVFDDDVNDDYGDDDGDNDDDDDWKPVRKKRKVISVKSQDEKKPATKASKASTKTGPKRKVAKASPKEPKTVTKKKEVKARKPRKTTEPKQRKKKATLSEKNDEQKTPEEKGSEKSKSVKNKKSSDESSAKGDQCVIKIEREDGDIDFWEADQDVDNVGGHGDDDAGDDYDDSDTDDYDNNMSNDTTVVNVSETKEEAADGDSPFKTVDDEGRVVKIRKERTKSGKKTRRRIPFPCSLCSKTLTSKKRLIFHEYSRHGTPIDYKNINFTVAPCEEEGCNYVAADRRSLEMHMKSRHGKARPHICEFCGKAFKLPNILATHLNIHTGSKIWKCTECGEQFNQQSGLQIHKKRYHMGEASWTEMCHMCSEKFLQKADLAWHLYKMHGQPLPDNYKMYTCDICGFSTMKYQQLKQHRERHDGIKNFTCPICQKGCSTKSELRRHVSFHGEKKYKCTFEGCSYACTDTIGLDKHIKLMHTHKDFKPYACPVCQYRTGVKGNVDKHIRTVHDLVVVTKHTVNLKMKYSNFDSGDVITKDGRLVATSKERKALQLVPTIDKEIGMTPNSETIQSVNNLTYADFKVKETADNDYSNIKKSKRHKAYRMEEQMMDEADIIKQVIPTVVNDASEGSKMETIINDLPPLNNYVYIHGGDMSTAAQDLRMQGVNPSTEAATLYTIGNAEMYGLHNKY